MDLKTLILMFIPFTTEIIISGIMLTKHKTNFRFHPVLSIAGGLLISYGVTFLNIFILNTFVKPEQWSDWLNILAYTIPFFGIYFGFLFTYKKEMSRLIVTLSIAYTFQSIVYQTIALVFDTGLQTIIYEKLGADWYQSYYSILYNITSLLIKVGLYLVFYFTFAKTYIKYAKYILSTWFSIGLGLVMYFVTNIANSYLVRHIWWDTKLRLIMCITLILFCLLYDIFIVGSFKIVEHKEENMIIKATLDSKIRQKEMNEKNMNFINMKCHDLRKELRRLKLKKDNLDDEDFLVLENSLNFFDSSVDTGDVNIDALIQDKLIYCNSIGIEFTSLIDGEAFKNLSNSDIYFLLTNIIDNAIEAVEQIENKDKRLITLTASNKHGILYIEQSNYFQGEIIINNDGSIKTTKKEGKYHGYGTKSIAYIVRKYDGKLDIDVTDDVFNLKIAI